MAQIAQPDITLPELSAPLLVPSPSPDFRLEGGPLLGVEPGGTSFVLTGIDLTGQTQLTAEALLQQVADRIGEETDFSVLQDIANTLSQYYRAAGYPFARAYLPAQDIQDGRVQIEILEGRYGLVQAVNVPEPDSLDGEQEPELARNEFAEQFLTPLQPGAIIESKSLERVALLLNDIPGFAVVPVVRPGLEPGTGDLEMRLTELNPWDVSLRFDNHGSIASGRHRARINVAHHRNIVFGDTLQWTALVTDEQTWLSTLNYEFPIGGSGLRLQFNGLLSQYQLGAGDFAGLASGGTQQIGTRVSYPFIRSQQANLNLNLGSQWTAYQNELLADTDRYQIATLPLGASFDVRDNLGLGGVTYGAVSLQLSRIVQDNRTRSAAQEYSVLSLDLGRVQQFSPPWQLQVRLSSQYSGSLIDSSDFIALGGFNAVRAYPVGEFSGQKGTVFQGELSYGLPQANATTYAFVDAGVATRSTPNGDSEQRALSGIGLGLRAGFNTLNIDVSASVPVTGGRSVAEPGHRGPWVWLAITNRF